MGIASKLFSIPDILAGWQGIAIRIGLIVALSVGAFGYGWVKRGERDAGEIAICKANILTLADSIDDQNKSIEAFKKESDTRLASAKAALTAVEARINTPSRTAEIAMLKKKAKPDKPSTDDCNKAISEIVKYKRSKQP